MRIAKNEDILLREKSVLAASLSELNSKLEEKVASQTGEIKRSYWDLKKLSEAKDVFVSIAQHNLRIPITNIGNKIDIVLSSTTDIKSRNQLLESKDSLLYLASIADEFKSISRIKPGSQILNLGTTSILSTLENILSELNSSIVELKLTVTYPKDIAMWPEVNIDLSKFKDALVVIIENAVKYNMLGGYIRIYNDITENCFKVTIENSGLGITSEEMSNICNQTFYRSDRVKNINPIGMGIGMSLAKSVIEAHHGSLVIESGGENMGAKVILSIPIDFLSK
jgi:signal transduction histidine kinase